MRIVYKMTQNKLAYYGKTCYAIGQRGGEKCFLKEKYMKN